MSEIAKHAEAVGQFLDSLRGSASLETALQQQAQKLIVLLDRCPMDVVEATALLKVFRGMPWTEKQLQMLTDKVAEVQASPGKSVALKRQALQDFTALPHYLTSGQWELLSGTKVNSNHKMNVILKHAVALGLRVPSEPSMQMVTALFLSVTHDTEDLQNMLPSMLHECLKAVKTSFKAAQ